MFAVVGFILAGIGAIAAGLAVAFAVWLLSGDFSTGPNNLLAGVSGLAVTFVIAFCGYLVFLA